MLLYEEVGGRDLHLASLSAWVKVTRSVAFWQHPLGPLTLQQEIYIF